MRTPVRSNIIVEEQEEPTLYLSRTLSPANKKRKASLNIESINFPDLVDGDGKQLIRQSTCKNPLLLLLTKLFVVECRSIGDEHRFRRSRITVRQSGGLVLATYVPPSEEVRSCR